MTVTIELDRWMSLGAFLITGLYIRVNRDKGYVLPLLVLVLFMTVTLFYFILGVLKIYWESKRNLRIAERGRERIQARHYRPTYDTPSRQSYRENYMEEEYTPRHRNILTNNTSQGKIVGEVKEVRPNRGNPDHSVASICDVSEIPQRLASRERLDVSDFAHDILKELDGISPAKKIPVNPGQGLRSGFISPQKVNYQIDTPNLTKRRPDHDSGSQYTSELPTGKSSTEKGRFNLTSIANVDNDRMAVEHIPDLRKPYVGRNNKIW